ncbi:hypothetical protein GB937_003856 [Aspergillus fischeri]|nr:hypothetical protein GB937_003856 [Aspergillus fischeri]
MNMFICVQKSLLNDRTGDKMLTDISTQLFRLDPISLAGVLAISGLFFLLTLPSKAVDTYGQCEEALPNSVLSHSEAVLARCVQVKQNWFSQSTSRMQLMLSFKNLVTGGPHLSGSLRQWNQDHACTRVRKRVSCSPCLEIWPCHYTGVPLRHFLGDKICRNPDWLLITVDYTVDTFFAAEDLRLWPRLIRPIVANFLPSCRKIRRELKEATEKLRDLEAARKANQPQKRYHDAIQLMEECAKGQHYPPAEAQMAFSIVAIHTTSDMLHAGPPRPLCESGGYPTASRGNCGGQPGRMMEEDRLI